MFRKLTVLFILFIGLASLVLLWSARQKASTLQAEEQSAQEALEKMTEVRTDWMILESLARMISGATK
jgi:uncharacterized membrane protein